MLRPGGVFQVSILHRCFHTRRWAWARDALGAAPPEARAEAAPFRVPRLYRALSGWLTLLLDAGLGFERVEEPAPPPPAAGERAVLPDARCIAWVLLVRCRATRSSGADGVVPAR